MQRPRVKHTQSSGNLVVEWGIEWSKLERSGTPEEDLQSLLTWAHVGPQRLGHQLGSMQKLDLDLLHICSKYAAWSSSGSPNLEQQIQVFPGVFCLTLDPIPLTGLPCLASVGEDVPSPAVT